MIKGLLSLLPLSPYVSKNILLSLELFFARFLWFINAIVLLSGWRKCEFLARCTIGKSGQSPRIPQRRNRHQHVQCSKFMHSRTSKFSYNVARRCYAVGFKHLCNSWIWICACNAVVFDASVRTMHIVDIHYQCLRQYVQMLQFIQCRIRKVKACNAKIVMYDEAGCFHIITCNILMIVYGSKWTNMFLSIYSRMDWMLSILHQRKDMFMLLQNYSREEPVLMQLQRKGILPCI